MTELPIRQVSDARITVELLRDAPIPWDIYRATAAVNTITSLIDALEAVLPELDVMEEVEYSLGEYGTSRAYVHIEDDRAKGIDRYVDMRVELQKIDGQWELTKREGTYRVHGQETL